MLHKTFRLFARLPLRWLHALGAAVGWLVWKASPRVARRIRENVATGAVVPETMKPARFERRVAIELGKGLAEMIAIWFRSAEAAAGLVVRTSGWELVDDALASGRGILFLTPHLGCFEASAHYAAMRMPLTVLYRPPKLEWLEPWMRASRTRGQGHLVPTTLAGVRRLLKALRAGQAVGLLPDHVPGTGEGVWAPFFGRPAFTMTLAGRLQAATGCAVIVAFCRRLPRGEGFSLELERIDEDLSGPAGAARLNAALERLIRRCPEQYLWSYNRYKVPAGAAPPGAPALEHAS
ncbi:MAG: lysophospholipid acyltransferase family protein [Betaproteobacteria bacterium]|nr:lysophospholipid acyltransferase family protein [Betaproteobacteria bacterium]